MDKYWHAVFARFLQQHARGVTPNPDLACNRHIKFDALLRFARNLGATAVATGHYARLRLAPGAEGQLHVACWGNWQSEETRVVAFYMCLQLLHHISLALCSVSRDLQLLHHNTAASGKSSLLHIMSMQSRQALHVAGSAVPLHDSMLGACVE